MMFDRSLVVGMLLGVLLDFAWPLVALFV